MLLSESPAGAQSIRRPGASGGSNVRASSSGGMMGWMCSSEPSDVVDPDTDIIDPATMAIVIVADQIDSFYQFAAGKETKDKPITQVRVWKCCCLPILRQPYFPADWIQTNGRCRYLNCCCFLPLVALCYA